MTESEWLTSEDPQAMLAYLDRRDPMAAHVPIVGVSDRKLRLWVFAMSARASGSTYARVHYGPWEDGAPDTDDDDRTAASVARDWARFPADGIDPGEQAALLREIVGDPFRPTVAERHYLTDARAHARVSAAAHAAWELGPARGRAGDEAYRRVLDGMVFRQAWCRRPDVLTLAAAAYGGGDRAADGTLDPLTLAALADALEDAGCCYEEVCLGCRGTCEVTDRRGRVWGCRNCGGNGHSPGSGRIHAVHPLLTHLRPPGGPHVRGCWALDLILGKD